MKFEDIAPLLLPHLSNDEVSVVREFYGVEEIALTVTAKPKPPRRQMSAKPCSGERPLMCLLVVCSCVVQSVLVSAAVALLMFRQNPVLIYILGILYSCSLCLGVRFVVRKVLDRRS